MAAHIELWAFEALDGSYVVLIGMIAPAGRVRRLQALNFAGIGGSK